MGASSTWVRWSLNSLATIVPFLRIFALKPVSRTVERGVCLHRRRSSTSMEPWCQLDETCTVNSFSGGPLTKCTRLFSLFFALLHG